MDRSLRQKFLIWVFLIFIPIKTLGLDAFEIQVYDSNINDVGVFILENHVNYVISGLTSPDYTGQLPNNHLIHWTYEFARGMTPSWELGAYLQTATTLNPQVYYAGVKLRSKFAVPKKSLADSRFQLGVNVEISNIPNTFEQSRWGGEIRPIFGYSWSRVTAIINPNLEFNFNLTNIPAFSPLMKISLDTLHGYALGLESYSGTGQINNVGSFDQQEHYLFATFDLLGRALELNAGIGGGLTSSSNSAVIKTIVGFEL